MTRSLGLPAAPWYHDGVRWECQGSGRCCLSRGEVGYVYLTLADRRRLAAHFKLSTAAFTRRYCQRQGDYWHLREEAGSIACRFLEANRCTVYEARPAQCRSWPFWPETIGAKAWQQQVASYCPGVGKGRLWTRAEIEAALETQRAEDEQR
jgi:Fe-S-cluster containining protein